LYFPCNLLYINCATFAATRGTRFCPEGLVNEPAKVGYGSEEQEGYDQVLNHDSKVNPICEKSS
jgi:hypothetical protein